MAMLYYRRHKFHSARVHLRILFETITAQNAAVQLLSDGLVRPVCQKVVTYLFKDANTLIERKSRVPQVRGIKGDAVVVYCEPLITKKMGCHRLSQRVNKMGFSLKFTSHL